MLHPDQTVGVKDYSFVLDLVGALSTDLGGLHGLSMATQLITGEMKIRSYISLWEGGAITQITHTYLGAAGLHK